MIVEGWEYYNHAVVPNCAPHESPNMIHLNDGSIWKIDGGKPFFARWTTEWDTKVKTEWWYVIKDKPFRMEEVKSKIRTKIRKGRKNFECKEILAINYVEEIYKVMQAALNSYRCSSELDVNHGKLLDDIKHWPDNIRVWGAFDESENLCSYTTVVDKGSYYKMVGHKSVPEYENKQVNAAVLYKMLEDLNDDIKRGKYVCNGERTVNHDTNFNDYLEEYFSFRKAYCTLHIKYRSLWWLAVKMVYPFRGLIKKFDDKRLPHVINSIMAMEEIIQESNHRIFAANR